MKRQDAATKVDPQGHPELQIHCQVQAQLRSSFRTMILASFLFLFLVLGLGRASPSSNYHQSGAYICSGLTLPKLQGFQVISVQSVEVYNYSLAASPPFNPTNLTNLNFCNTTITLTHKNDGDRVIVQVWTPLHGWNGRFQATGGGGLRAGLFEIELAPAVSRGYAAAGTDAGNTLGNTIDPNTGTWVLKNDGTVNRGLVENFAYRSGHDLAVVGKAVTKAFYGQSPKYSYWNGCSTGGRQGYFEAQRYPNDFDGILAYSPAINTPQVSPADFWPSVVMANAVAPPQCVFTAFQQAMVAACDPLDGVTDGLISDTSKCTLDSQDLVGTIIPCGQGNLTITQAFADVVSKILQGATSSTGDFLWYGNPPGAPFNGLANTQSVNGSTIPVPFGAAEAWIRYFVFEEPQYDTAHMTFAQFEEAFDLSVNKYMNLFGTDDPDLSGFRKAGGRLLTWHGLADPLIAHLGTVRYRERLEEKMGGAETVDEFYRLFLAPGVGHCSGGIGPNPIDPLAVLVDWVEKGKVPETLPATTNVSGIVVTRDLCRFPKLLKYDGRGDTSLASSFTCK
jgi:feruloyl esterase